MTLVIQKKNKDDRDLGSSNGGKWTDENLYEVGYCLAINKMSKGEG